VFKADVADVSDVDAGDPVTVLDAGGRFIGRGLFNPRPALCCRIYTWSDEPFDAEFLARRIRVALSRREHGEGEAARLVWSEADGLPGLVVDRYGPVLVIQCLTLGIARQRAVIVAALREQLGDLLPRRVERLGELAALDLAQSHARKDREHADLRLLEPRELAARALERGVALVELAARIAEHPLDQAEHVVTAQHRRYQRVIVAPVVATS
jgi:23S rRNA (cytosine1962-C5)-methyltransferase